MTGSHPEFKHYSWCGKPALWRKAGTSEHSYLLDAQAKAGAWSDAETTMRQIATMVSDVASPRGVVLLARILPELKHAHVPRRTREIAEQLALLLRQANT